MLKRVSELHPLKADVPIDLSPDDTFTAIKLVHDSKTLYPIDVIVLSMVTSVNFVKPLKALFGMCDTPSIISVSALPEN